MSLDVFLKFHVEEKFKDLASFYENTSEDCSESRIRPSLDAGKIRQDVLVIGGFRNYF